MIAIFTVDLISVKLLEFVVILCVAVHAERLMDWSIQVYLVHVDLVFVAVRASLALIVEVRGRNVEPVRLLIVRL